LEVEAFIFKEGDAMKMREDRLNSWKEISEYTNRGIVTCWNWARRLGFPVHRIDKSSSRSKVFAYKSEIEKWFEGRDKVS
jgi:hypothetical protein